MKQSHSRVSRSAGLVLAAVVTVSAGLIPGRAEAKGVIWLKTKVASSTTGLIHPSMATYRNHAYILSVKETATGKTSVLFTTNESKHWKTTVVSSHGPHASYSQEFVALAIDASQNKLYATWIYEKDRQHVTLGVWTRTGTGAWTGPTDIVTAGALVGEPSIVAGNGHATVAFMASPQDVAGSCNDRTTHAEDVAVASTSGGGWSSPENLTSCATAKEAISFNDPKLAADEDGKLYLVSRAGAVEGNLWYAENRGTSWTQASALTSGLKIPEFALSPAQRTLYSVAASRGTAYVLYTTGQKSATVQMLVRGADGRVSGPVRASRPDKEGCPQYGIAVAARAGRVLVTYIRAYSGNCATISPTNDFNTFEIMQGTASHLSPVSPGLPRTASCGDSALSTDGDLFRLAAACGLGLGQQYGKLYFKKEFLDVVGPKARLRIVGRTGTGRVTLRWSAHDPTPGSGVASYQLQVRRGTGAWGLVASATHARTAVYQTQRGAHYTFRLRARDRVNNWGKWVSATNGR